MLGIERLGQPVLGRAGGESPTLLLSWDGGAVRIAAPDEGKTKLESDGAMTSSTSSGAPVGLAVGELLEGKYQIKRELGRGAMGVVYEALHVALGRPVAVKTLLDEVSADAQMSARFEREARAASATRHPNIVDVFDLGRTRDGLLFMVMELLEGESLASRLKRTPRLSAALAIRLMSQVLSGLSAAHKQGIVHRDLKPDNIFVLDSDERPSFVKIVDFGISKVLQPGPALHGNATAKVAGTMVGAVLGTPLYMSPEQAVGQVSVIDHRTDIYSAGVVLYEMLCGRTPYLGQSYIEIFAGLLEGKYPSPRSLAPDIPPDLEAVIVRALDRDMNRRFPSAAAMREALGGGTAEATPAPLPMPASLGEPLPLADGGQAVMARTSIALAQASPTRRVAKRQGQHVPGTDPFAPPPEKNLSPLLVDDLDHPLALAGAARAEGGAGDDKLELPGAAEPAPAPAASRGQAGARIPAPRQGRARLPRAGAILVALAAILVAYAIWRGAGRGQRSSAGASGSKVLLSLVPEHSSVQIDHRPTTLRALGLEPGSTHVLNAAAPGRLTRRFSFVARPGLALHVYLSHTVASPSATDPPPLPAELAAEAPERARDGNDVEGAFAKLDLYGEALAVMGDASADRHGRTHLRGEDDGRFRSLVEQAAAATPAMPELDEAARAAATLFHGNPRPEQSARALTSWRAELLAARAAWQLEELAYLEKLEGQSAEWRMRRLALAALAWQRASKAGAGAQAAAKLRGDAGAVLDKQNPGEPMPGQADFMLAARVLLELAGPSTRRPSEMAVLDGCRRLISAFNALILP